jgi:hypothetical protein
MVNMSFVQLHNLLNVWSYRRFRGSYSRWLSLHVRFFLAISIGLLLSVSLCFAQSTPGQNGQRRLQPKPMPQGPQQGQQQTLDAKRMEHEERRRLRQEIQRHGPDYRVKDAGLMPAPAIAGPPPHPSNPPHPMPLQPLPSYFGSPVFPASTPNGVPPNGPSPSLGPGTSVPRGPALSQEERQQLRQQIRDERKRGLYPTPTEVDR